MHTNELMTVADIAAELKLGNSSIWRKVKDGSFPKPIKIGGSTRWRRSDLDYFLDQLPFDKEAPSEPTSGNKDRHVGKSNTPTELTNTNSGRN